MFRFNFPFTFALYINIFILKNTCVLLSAFSLIKADLLPHTNGLQHFSDTRIFIYG